MSTANTAKKLSLGYSHGCFELGRVWFSTKLPKGFRVFDVRLPDDVPAPKDKNGLALYGADVVNNVIGTTSIDIIFSASGYLNGFEMKDADRLVKSALDRAKSHKNVVGMAISNHGVSLLVAK